MNPAYGGVQILVCSTIQIIKLRPLPCELLRSLNDDFLKGAWPYGGFVRDDQTTPIRVLGLSVEKTVKFDFPVKAARTLDNPSPLMD